MLQGFGGQLLLGMLATVELAAAALVVGSVFGLVGCWLQLRRHRVPRSLGYLYAAIVRGVPDLLVVFAVYFGGSVTLALITGEYVEIGCLRLPSPSARTLPRSRVGRCSRFRGASERPRDRSGCPRSRHSGQW